MIKNAASEGKKFDAFVEKIKSIHQALPDSSDIQTLLEFYAQGRESILSEIEQDGNMGETSKEFVEEIFHFSFRIEGDLKMIAEKRELLQLDESAETNEGDDVA